MTRLKYTALGICLSLFFGTGLLMAQTTTPPAKPSQPAKKPAAPAAKKPVSPVKKPAPAKTPQPAPVKKAPVTVKKEPVGLEKKPVTDTRKPVDKPAPKKQPVTGKKPVTGKRPNNRPANNRKPVTGGKKTPVEYQKPFRPYNVSHSRKVISQGIADDFPVFPEELVPGMKSAGSASNISLDKELNNTVKAEIKKDLEAKQKENENPKKDEGGFWNGLMNRFGSDDAPFFNIIFIALMVLVFILYRIRAGKMAGTGRKVR